MKKSLLILLALLVYGLPSFAVITPEDATSEDYIKNHGHSDEMSRLIDLQNAQINGSETHYVKKEPAWYSNKSVSFIRKVFMQYDCGLDDEKFAEHNTNYTTKWTDY